MKNHFTSKASLGAVVFIALFCRECNAQSVNCDTRVALTDAATSETLSALVTKASLNLNVSVIAELVNSANAVTVPPEPISFRTILSLFSARLSCESIGTVIHVYDSHAIESRDNALNFKFDTFDIPNTVGHFSLDLRERLRDDPWLQYPKKRKFIQKGSGFLPDDYQTFALRNETVVNVTARQILFRVASEQKILSLIELAPPSANLKGEKAWHFADAHWNLVVIRPSN